MKPVLLGMNNPYSYDDYYALYPEPENSAGARLCAMFLAAGERAGYPVTRQNYIDGFERRNLVRGDEWSMTRAKAAALPLFPLLQGKKVVICGKSVLKAMELRDHGWLTWSNRARDPVDYINIPHPSGLCREYNNLAMVNQVGDLLLSLYRVT